MDLHPPPRVLIVEDESLVSLMIEETVSDQGWEVVGPAPRLASALELVRSEKFDAAVLDVNLHGAAVYRAAELLAERNFFTGYGTGEIDPRFQERPIVRKPLTGSVLANALQRLVGNLQVAAN